MADINFTIDLRATQKTIIVEDNLTYGLSWPIAGTVAVITITGPKGVIYANTDFDTPDIVPATSKFLNKTIELPLDPQTNYTNILKGNYTLKVTWYNPILDQEYEFLKTYQYNFDNIEITNTTVSGPYSGTLISEDTTEYGSHIYSLSREHRVIYPTQLDPLVADIVSSDEVIMVNPIYTNQWGVQITTNIEYRNADELRILWEGYGEFTHYVYGSCISAMAGVIDIMLSNYYNIVAPQSYNQEAYQKRLTIVNTAWQLLTLAYYQGDVEEADKQSYVIQEQVKYSGATLPGSTSSILVVPCPPWEGGVFPEGSYIFENGLIKTLDDVPHVKLGGALIEATTIDAGVYGFNISGASGGNSFSQSMDYIDGIKSKVSNGTTEGRVLVEYDGVTIGLANLATPSNTRTYEFGLNGLVESSDYKSGYTNRSLIAKDYVDLNFLLNTDGSYGNDFEEKVAPIGDDVILIEDSEDGYAKKWVKASSISTPSTFLGLSDTFNTYTGNANKAVMVNSGQDALIAYDLTQTYIHTGTANQISALTNKTTPVGADVVIIEDSQAGYAKKKVLLSAIQSTSTETFLDLTDTPNDYTGFGGYFVTVKSDLSGLEFITGTWVPVTGGTYTGRVYFSTINVNGIVAKRSDIVGTPGTPTAAENYVEFQDGDGDVQGRIGMDSSGNIYLTTNVGGGKVYLNKSTYVNGDITLSGLVDTVDIAAFKTVYDSHTHTFASLTSKPNTLSGYGITDAIITTEGYFDIQFPVKAIAISTDRLLIEDSEDDYIKKYITIASITPDLPALNYWTKTGSDVSYTAGTVTVQTLDGIIIGTSGVLSAISEVPVDMGGTGITSYGTSNQILGMNNAASVLEYKTFTGTNMTIDHHTGEIEFIIPQDIATTASPTFVKAYGTGNITDSTQFTTKYYVDGVATGGVFLDYVDGMQVNNTLNPTLTLGKRYILLNVSSLHANFGTISGVGNNDIVEYGGSVFTVVFDASAASLPTTVTVGLDKNAATNHQWTYSSSEWIDRGALSNHNNLNGLNVGDYVHLTATEYTHSGTAYSHSQITGSNPHAVTLALMSESYATINYWTKSGSNLNYTAGKIGIGGTSVTYGQLQINNATHGDYSVIASYVSDGTNNPRIILNHKTSASTNIFEFNSSYASGSGYATWKWANNTTELMKLYPSGCFAIGGGNDLTGKLRITQSALGGTGGYVEYVNSAAIVVSATNYNRAFVISHNTNFNIATGITDSGYRIGLDISAEVNDTDFAGTISSTYGSRIAFGTNLAGMTGIITNAYGIYLQGLKTGGTITNFYSIYSSHIDSKMYHAGSIGVGIVPISKAHIYESTTNTSTTAGLTIEQGSTGDSQLQYLLTGGQRWVSGIDNSDSDSFKIGRGADWVTGVDIKISTAGAITLGSLAGYIKGTTGVLSASTTIPMTDISTTGRTVGQLLRATAATTFDWTTLTMPNTIAALSVFVSNSANVLTAITPGASNSIRINSGGTAWEAYSSYTKTESNNNYVSKISNDALSFYNNYLTFNNDDIADYDYISFSTANNQFVFGSASSLSTTVGTASIRATGFYKQGGTITQGLLADGSVTSISAFAKTFLDDAADVNVRATLGLTIGSHVQAFSYTLQLLSDSSASFTTNAGFVKYDDGDWSVDTNSYSVSSHTHNQIDIVPDGYTSITTAWDLNTDENVYRAISTTSTTTLSNVINGSSGIFIVDVSSTASLLTLVHSGYTLQVDNGAPTTGTSGQLLLPVGRNVITFTAYGTSGVGTRYILFNVASYKTFI